MALTKGVNSYDTVEAADAYFADRLDVAAWLEATPEQRAQAMVTATTVLDNQLWSGVAVSESQPLAHPRQGTYFDPRVGCIVSYNGEVPLRLLKATYELAYHLLNNDGLLDNTGSVDSLSIGSIQLSNVRAASGIPDVVFQMIRPMLVAGNGKMWWRAN